METKVFQTRLNDIRREVNVDFSLLNGFRRHLIGFRSEWMVDNSKRIDFRRGLTAILEEPTRFRGHQIPKNSVMAGFRLCRNADSPAPAAPFRFSMYMSIHIFYATAYLLMKVLKSLTT